MCQIDMQIYTKLKRILSTLLVFAVILSCVGWLPVRAQSAEIESPEESAQNSSEFQQEQTQTVRVSRLYVSKQFAQYLNDGDTIIEAFFKAGYYGESLETNDDLIQKVLYISETENETIYTPYQHYDYDPSDVKIKIHHIHSADIN